ncbi:HAD-IA family hydrolase [Tsukamurella sp. 8F]|uniref:HAD-IA family hydrolase n=1 Tax=unclassified Tsukamurella TaxID=2633480 RepID=UPI0023B9E308|nr:MULTISPECIES: HAD-IA family hydrolase [unclassified Tsukamurella]MDF0531278.1 HAD-IA family hydrolase [Tsukamurella sp. 8J]MDF0585227.1 HAD-IA family hydrolase [Tsukamurella sp. 8F]
MTAVEAVVFDYGGVLTGPMRDTIAGFIATEGIDPASFTEALRAWLSRSAPEGTPVHLLETGELAPAEFDVLLAGRLRRIDGKPVVAEGLLGRLFAGTVDDAAMWALAQELVAQDVRVALLSNSWGNRYPRGRLDALFDPVVISEEVGLRKPRADSFEYTLRALGTASDGVAYADAPERVAFVDDAQPNIDGAEAVGMRGVLHTGAPTTRAALAALLQKEIHA